MLKINQKSRENEAMKNKIPQIEVRSNIRSGLNNCSDWCSVNCTDGTCTQTLYGECKCDHYIIK